MGAADLRSLRNAARAAADHEALGALLTDEARARIGVSGVCFMPVIPGAPLGAETSVFHAEFGAEHLQAQTLRWFPATMRDAGSLESLAASGAPSFDVNERLGTAFARTETFNEYWRPCRIERQILSVWHASPERIGYLCVTRSLRERAFDANDVALLGRLGAIAAQQSARLVRGGRDRSAVVLAGLARGMPIACALFDSLGRALFCSEASRAEVAVDGETWRRAAIRCLEAGSVVCHEHLRAERIETHAGVPVAFVTSSTRAHRSEGATLDDAQSRWGLSSRETEVLAELARGGSNKEIAAALKISVKTTEIHVSSLLRKAGCTSRSELLARHWAQR